MNCAIRFDGVSVHYGPKLAIRELTLAIPEKQIFGIIGPASSGKTTLLKCINRTLEFTPAARMSGTVTVAGRDVSAFRNVYELRRRVGMVFPLPIGLPLSIYENVAYAPRRAGLHDRGELDVLVERCLRQAMLWDEVCDRLDLLGTQLSGGQQQRLTLARALSHRPEILCLDEFSIAIDPVTTMKIEDVLLELRQEMTIVLVTNLVQQARRLADRTAFLSAACLIEEGETEALFTRPANRLTQRYVNGEFGQPMMPAAQTSEQYSIQTRELNLWYGTFQALCDINLDVKPGLVTALVGPSGCGKTTLLRSLNRINERYGNVTMTGRITVLGKNIYDSDVSLSELRKSVGMVFQRPNPLPISIRENVLFGLRVHCRPGAYGRAEQDALVESALRDVQLWDEVKDRLRQKATALSLNQQQRLCIARLLPLKPRVILMDEPCSALDAEGIEKIEDLIRGLRGSYTMLIVTHNMAQARRASDETIFMLLGRTIEHDKTVNIFLNPKHHETEMYVTGRYG